MTQQYAEYGPEMARKFKAIDRKYARENARRIREEQRRKEVRELQDQLMKAVSDYGDAVQAMAGCVPSEYRQRLDESMAFYRATVRLSNELADLATKGA